MVVVEEQPASAKTSSAAMRACMTIPSLIDPCGEENAEKEVFTTFVAYAAGPGTEVQCSLR
jgi:hypothetical protein